MQKEYNLFETFYKLLGAIYIYKCANMSLKNVSFEGGNHIGFISILTNLNISLIDIYVFNSTGKSNFFSSNLFSSTQLLLM